MKLNIIFLESKQIFNQKEKQQIKNIIRNTVNYAVGILNLKNIRIINFTLYRVGKSFTWGIAESKDLINLYIPKKKINENDIKSAIYHELHHIARDFTFFTKRKVSFLDTLFSEGLAVVFEIEQVPKRIPSYSKYTKNLIQKWIPELKKEKLMGSEFSHDEWFWGRKGKPYRLGYKIGTYFVNQIKKNYPNLTATKLVRRKVKDLLRLSMVKLV